MNMPAMSVTLEVSKLSGWLNFDAYCRESKEGMRCGARHTSRQAGGGGRPHRARRVQRREIDCRLGAGHGEERTQNMSPMVVTLEVSKLSGWLNDDAYCRESKGGHAVRGEVYGSAGGRRQATAVQAACRRGLDCRLGAGHEEERT